MKHHTRFFAMILAIVMLLGLNACTSKTDTKKVPETAVAPVDPCADGHSWKEATCTVPKICTVCGETEGEALGHTPACEASYAEGSRCSVCGEEVGAALRNSMVFDTEPNYSLNYACAECNKEGTELIENSPLTITTDKCNWVLSDVMAEPADDPGYTKISYTVVSKGTTIIACLSEDFKYFQQAAFRHQFPGNESFDLYSGKIYPGRETMNNDKSELTFLLENENGSYQISYTKDVTQESNWGEVSTVNQPDDSGKISTIYRVPLTIQFTVKWNFLVPEDYDGLCLAVRKEGTTELDLDANSDDSQVDTEQFYILFDPYEDGDVYSPEDYYFIRISNLL